MAIEVIHTIKPDGTGDYTGLASWEAAQQRDLVTLNEIAVAECYTGTDNSSIHTYGWVTNSNCYIHLRAKNGHENNGVIGAGFVTGTFHLQAGILKFDNIQLNISQNGPSTGVLTANNTIWSGSGSSVRTGKLLLTNCLFNSDGRALDTRGSNSIISNCTIYTTGDYGIIADSGTTITNTIALGATAQCFWAGAAQNGTNNASSDTTASSLFANSLGNISLIDGVDFVAPSLDDYSVAAGSQLIDAGIDLSAQFTTDIVGTVRG